MEQHDLNHEFPEYREQIHVLKMSNGHFARLFDEYHDVNNGLRTRRTQEAPPETERRAPWHVEEFPGQLTGCLFCKKKSA